MNKLITSTLVVCILLAGCGSTEQGSTNGSEATDRVDRAESTKVTDKVMPRHGGYVSEPAQDGSVKCKMHLSEDGAFQLVIIGAENGSSTAIGSRKDILGTWREIDNGVELVTKDKTYTLPSEPSGALQLKDADLGVDHTLNRSN